MIFGLNFNRTELPPGYAKRFRKRLVLNGVRYQLQGIAESPLERDDMLVQATNGTRKLHVEVRRTAGPTLFGIYVA